MAKGYVVIMLSIFIICTGCSRTSKEVELQNKVDQLQKQLDDLNGVKHEEDAGDVKETSGVEESEISSESESETEINTNEIGIKEVDLPNESKEEIYNDAVSKFQNGEFEPAQQMFVQLEDYKDSHSYRQYLNLLVSIQNKNYKFHLGENIGKIININGFTMNVDGQQYPLRVIKKFKYYFLTTASLDSNGEELCIDGDNGTLYLTKMQFTNGEVSVFRSQMDRDSEYISDARKDALEKRRHRHDELGESERTSKEYISYTSPSPSEPLIGMTAQEVLDSAWGKPMRINKTTFAWGVTEQWCYYDNRYVYLKNGSVTAIQE